MSAFGVSEVSDSLFSGDSGVPALNDESNDQQEEAFQPASNNKSRNSRSKRPRHSTTPKKNTDPIEKFHLDFNLVYNEEFQRQAESKFPHGWAQLQPGAPLRRGKWSEAESKYVDELVNQFHQGIITNLPEGTSLRAYLATALRCDPMRITKKYQAEEAIGKRIYRTSGRPQAESEMKQAESNREHLAMKFIESLNEKANRKRDRRSGSSTPRSKQSRKNPVWSSDHSKGDTDYTSLLKDDDFTGSLPVQGNYFGDYPMSPNSVSSADQTKNEADPNKGALGASYLEQIGDTGFSVEQAKFEVDESAIDPIKSSAADATPTLNSSTSPEAGGTTENTSEEGHRRKSKSKKSHGQSDEKKPSLHKEESETNTNGNEKSTGNGSSAPEKKKVKLGKGAGKKSKSRKSKRNRLSSVDSTNSEVRAAEMLRSLSSNDV
eukprot:gb/GECG01009792.1/.p1 GENE.gb/GECG01009792.1/~~gb/GECG01009792.1/.p1  ORF type:complete len:434 (+),score=84.41 gb/GECG01009792.1/:1-1302(+)